MIFTNLLKKKRFIFRHSKIYETTLEVSIYFPIYRTIFYFSRLRLSIFRETDKHTYYVHKKKTNTRVEYRTSILEATWKFLDHNVYLD